MAAMMGMPPATAASKAIERPIFRARSNNSGPCSANRALLAVTTSLPLSSSFRTMVRAGSSPPTNSTAATISGLSVTLARSSVSTPGGRAKFRGRFRSVSTTRTNSSLLPARSGDPVAVLQQQPGHAGADGAESDDGDFGDVHSPMSSLRVQRR